MTIGRRRAVGCAVAALPVLAHAAPSLSVLSTFLPAPAWRLLPAALPDGLCRWAGPPFAPGVVLSFDDGPSPASLHTLELLDDLNLRASFFLLGEQVEEHPGIVAEIVQAGHEVASHGMTHRHHLLASPGAVLADVAAGRAALQAAGAPAPRFFRPPYGQLAAASVVAARRCAMEIVLWSRWGREFTLPPAEEVVSRLVAGLRPGAILLLHDSDTHCPLGTASLTHAVLPALAAALAERHLATVTLGHLTGAA